MKAAVHLWRERVRRTVVLREASRAASQIGRKDHLKRALEVWTRRFHRRLLLRRVLDGWMQRWSIRIGNGDMGASSERAVTACRSILSAWRGVAQEQREDRMALALEDTAAAFHRARTGLLAIRTWKRRVLGVQLARRTVRRQHRLPLLAWYHLWKRRSERVALFMRHFRIERPMQRAIHALQRNATAVRAGRVAILRRTFRRWAHAAEAAASAEFERRSAIGAAAFRRVASFMPSSGEDGGEDARGLGSGSSGSGGNRGQPGSSIGSGHAGVGNGIGSSTGLLR